MISTETTTEAGRTAHKYADRPLRIWLPVVRAGSGSDVFTMRLEAGLKRAGHDPILQWFPPRYELMPWRLRHFAPPPSTDVIHANSWQGFAFKRKGIPLVVTEHHYVEDPAFTPYRTAAQAAYHRLFISRCLCRSYEAADAIIAVSRHTAMAMEAKLNIEVPYIYNWVDTSVFGPATGPSVSAPSSQERPFRLLFVGNPSARKGADLLPALANRLGDKFEVRCLGGLRQEHADRESPSNLVRLSPVKPEEMPAVYHSADAALVLSRYEAFGYVALEAMACGLPVVGFDTTGTSEICVTQVTALLVRVEDLEGLATACRMLAHDDRLCRRLAENGRDRAISEFVEKAAIQSYLDIYRSLKPN